MTVNAVSTLQLWGQAYKLTVKYATADGTSQSNVLSCNEWEPEALRITFEVLQSMIPSPWWFADISVYNMTSQAIQDALLNATWITLEAGFQTGPNKSTIIWDGPILQTLYDREEVVDQRITFHCVANPFVMEDIVSFAMGPFSSQAQLVAQMASAINLPEMSEQAGTVGPTANKLMTQKQYLRGNTVFGKVGKYLNQIGNDQFLNTFRDGSKAYISEMSRSDTTPDLIYSPPFPPGSPVPSIPGNVTYSIIGVPRQIPQGVIFEVLLDPRLKVGLPPLVVQLQRTLISQIAVLPGQNVSAPLGANLKFFVSQVRHVGDSRGNSWQTEVTGVSTTYADSLLDGVFGANSQGGA